MSKKHKAISTTFASLGVLLVLQAADCSGLLGGQKKQEEPTKGVAPVAASDTTTVPGKGAEEKPVAKVLPQETETETKTKTETETEDVTSEESGKTTAVTPKTYHFNQEGMFVDQHGNGYTYDERTYSEAVGQAKNEVVKRLKKHGIVDQGSCFASNNIPRNADNTKVIVIVPGMLNGGKGVFSGSVLVNEGLKGSMLPIIKEAKDQGYPYFVISNSKESKDIEAAFGFVKGLDPSEIKVVAHSRGVEDAISAIDAYPDLNPKIKGVVYVNGGPKDKYELSGKAQEAFPGMRIIDIPGQASRKGQKYDLTTPSDAVDEVFKELNYTKTK